MYSKIVSRIILAVVVCFISVPCVLGQEENARSKYLSQYPEPATMSPKQIWEEFLQQSVSDGYIASAVSYIEPYRGWAFKEAQRRGLDNDNWSHMFVYEFLDDRHLEIIWNNLKKDELTVYQLSRILMSRSPEYRSRALQEIKKREGSLSSSELAEILIRLPKDEENIMKYFWEKFIRKNPSVEDYHLVFRLASLSENLKKIALSEVIKNIAEKASRVNTGYEHFLISDYEVRQLLADNSIKEDQRAIISEEFVYNRLSSYYPADDLEKIVDLVSEPYRLIIQDKLIQILRRQELIMAMNKTSTSK